MSHLYPIAISADDALNPDNPAALTRAEAEKLAEGQAILSLETEWMTVSADKAENILKAADAAQGHAFIQTYENEEANPVLAITYWRVSEVAIATAPTSEEDAPASADTDHTDDLYFRAGRTKKRGQRKKIDTRQMDLFQASDTE